MTMTDRPALFQGPMVRALLDGRKTMTRRLAWREIAVGASTEDATGEYPGSLAPNRLPLSVPTVWQKVEPGDRLWVRENWYGEFWNPEDIDGLPREHWDTPRVERTADLCSKPWYQADEQARDQRFAFVPEGQWAPSIHMPRWASRLTLVVTEAKLERLREISEADAIAEGIDRNPVQHGTWIAYPERSSGAGWADPRMSFGSLWRTLHTEPGNRWEDNPMVVAVTFTVHRVNIDKMEQAA
jgi:hypothetical protein